MESFFNSNSCRICLVENAAMEISEMSKDFQELTGFHVSPSDPQKICPMCAGNLVRLKQFINLCKITEEYLEKFRVKSFVTQDLIPTESVFIKNETSIGSGQIEFYQTVSNETYEQQIQVPGNFEMKKKYKKAPRPNHVACTVCHKIFKRDYLRKHMQYYHTPRQKYQCDICKKMVGIKGNLEKHIKAVHLGIKIIQKKKEQKDLQNNVNEVVYFEQPVPGNVDEHFQNDENYEEEFAQQYVQDQCDENNYFEEFVPETVEEPLLMKVEEPINFEAPVPMKVKVRCEICHSEVNQSYLKKHMAYFHTNQQIHICKFCNREFNIKGNMTKHIEIVHLGINKYKTIKPGSKQKESEKISKKVICAVCGTAIDPTELKEHIQSQHPEDRAPFQCDVCKQFFTQKYTLKQHMQHIHLNSYEKYPCEYCGKTSRSKHALYAHVRDVHENIKSRKCEECGKTFAREQLLKFHMKIHVKGKEVSCPICGAMFKNNRDLWTHKFKVHSERKFKCTVCEKAFKNTSNLKQHELIHFPDAYQCPVCPKGFSQQSTLRGHVKALHPEYKMPPKGTSLINVDINKLSKE